MGGQKGCQDQFQACCNLLKNNDLFESTPQAQLRLMFAKPELDCCLIPFDSGE
jgi:hypothetical protein